VDLHKKYATISVRNEQGTEEKFIRAQADIKGYVATLGSEDVVVLEASAGALYWAGKIQGQGARCVVIDAYRFRIIRDSWQKTDKRDAINLSLALWLASRSGEMKLPEVWQPDAVVRELRRLFGMYDLLNKQVRQLKNEVHGVLLDNGIRDRALGNLLVEHPRKAEELLKTVELSAASAVCIRTSLALLGELQEKKQTLKGEIYQTGKPLEAQVKLLLSIRGVTPLLALAFLSEVGDIKRFRSARKLHSYLGVVPTVRSSGGITHNGAINRRSRKLSRTLFTQAAIHLVDSSPILERFDRKVVERKGYGRARIALLRKVFSMMRRMLLARELYRWTEWKLYEKKLSDYAKKMKRGEKSRGGLTRIIVVWRTIESWIQLKGNETLFLECAEDLDIVAWPPVRVQGGSLGAVVQSPNVNAARKSNAAPIGREPFFDPYLTQRAPARRSISRGLFAGSPRI
jgi:transposase